MELVEHRNYECNVVNEYIVYHKNNKLMERLKKINKKVSKNNFPTKKKLSNINTELSI